MIERIRKLGNGIHDIDGLRAHLQTAIEVEHSTIPPYLCALYSLHGTDNSLAAYVVRSVVMEEMLHMALAANVLNAIGGEPKIDKGDFMPQYPAKLPGSAGEFEVELLPFSRKALHTFLRIEQPEKIDAPPEADHYHTLGQFYHALDIGLRTVCAGDKHFSKTPRNQVMAEQYYGSAGELIAVTNLETALTALATIRDQGEGVKDKILDGDPGLFGEGKNYAHYFRFNELVHGRFYDAKDKPSDPPSGGPLKVDWDAVYPMRPNPHAKDFAAGSEVRAKVDGFNRAYSDFLRLLHKAFNGAPERLTDSVPVMYGLRHRAVELMRIPSGGGMNAGPAFEFVAGHAERAHA